MKVIFVAPKLAVGGFERQWSLLVPGLVANGLDTEVVTLDGTGRFFDELTSQGVRTQCLELRGRANVVGALRAAREIAARQPDVLVSTGTSAHVVGQLAGQRANARHVAAVHSIPEHRDSFTRRRRAIVRLLAPHVAASTAVTSAQVEFVASLGFDRSRIHVIPNGVPPQQVRRSRDEVRAELGVTGDAFLALLIASLRAEKRVDRFVAAVSSARVRDARVQGLVAGTGPELERVRELCARHGCRPSPRTRTDTVDLIHASDVVCLTSDAEALPLVVLEAMAGSRPVLASDVGGVRDAVVNGETGFVVAAPDVPLTPPPSSAWRAIRNSRLGSATPAAVDRRRCSPSTAWSMHTWSCSTSCGKGRC